MNNLSTQNLDVQKQNYFNMTQPEENHTDVDGIQFRTVLTEQAVEISSLSSDAKIQFKFGVQITNNTESSHQFLLFFARPQFLQQNGTTVGREGPNFNKRSLPSLTDFQMILPKQSLTFLMQGSFHRYKRDVGFWFTAKNGGSWRFDPFAPGDYFLQIIYKNVHPVWMDATDLGEPNRFEFFEKWQEDLRNTRSVESDVMQITDVWTGEVTTPSVKFCLFDRYNC